RVLAADDTQRGAVAVVESGTVWGIRAMVPRSLGPPLGTQSVPATGRPVVAHSRVVPGPADSRADRVLLGRPGPHLQPHGERLRRPGGVDPRPGGGAEEGRLLV